LGQSTLVVLCAGSTLLLTPVVRPAKKPASINLQKWFLSPTGRLNLGFTIEGNLPLCSSHLPLGVPNWANSTTNSDRHQDLEDTRLTKTNNKDWD
jgi:hypothetical protein